MTIFLKMDEAADMLGVDCSWIVDAIEKDQLPGHHINGQMFVSVDDLADFVIGLAEKRAAALDGPLSDFRALRLGDARSDRSH